MHEGITEGEKEVFKLISPEVMFDVGVRDDLSYYNIKPECEYHLFEPHKPFTDLLKKKLAKRVILNKYGLSDKQEKLTYYPNTQSFVYQEWEHTDVGLKYVTKTIDWYCKKNSIKKIDFLKIDTEGFDYKVLLGANKMMPNIKYIQFEYWDGVWKFKELLKNFELFLIKESKLLTAIRSLSNDKKYDQLLTPITNEVATFIDEVLIKVLGSGGNVLCKRK